MWETLARKRPWSWLTVSTIKEALCDFQMTLPMLELWPSYIQSIITECLKDPRDRPGFCTLHEHLLAIRNSGEGLTSEVLDEAFSDWYEFQCGAIYAETRGRRTTIPKLPPRSNTGGASEIYIMLRRSSSQGNGRRRSTTIKGGLKDALKRLSSRAQDSPREEDIERFGYEIAERLVVARNIRRLARNYMRASWAKEVVLTRAIEGDIDRVKRKTKPATSANKRENSSRRGRKYSVFNQESFERILTTSSKYQKKDWSKVLHGMEKLKNSINGFKGKVNEELIEYGRQPLTDDDSLSEHGYEDTVEGINDDLNRTDSQTAAAKESLALLLRWEKNRATQRAELETPSRGIVKSPREAPKKQKGDDKSATINKGDSSSLHMGDRRGNLHELDTRKSARLRTQTLRPTVLPAQKSHKPRTQSARQTRVEKSEQTHRSEMTRVINNIEGTRKVEKTSPRESDDKDGSLHRSKQGISSQREKMRY